MDSPYAKDLHVVRVLMTDNLVEGTPAAQLWVAFTRDDPVKAVKAKVPPHWKVERTDQRLTIADVEKHGLRPGDVRELSSR